MKKRFLASNRTGNLKSGLFRLTCGLALFAGLPGPYSALQGTSPTYNTILYVSPFGSDSNTGASWSAAKATLNGALGALPNCTAADVKGDPSTIPCGQIEVDAGTMPIPSPVTITSPLISIIGRGSASTQFTWGGAGCAITINVGSGSSAILPGPTLQGFSIDGTGNQNAASCGIEYTNRSAVDARDLVIVGFAASGDSCLWGSTGVNNAERADFHHVYLGNCTAGWKLTDDYAGGFDTAGYGDIDMYINVEEGQTGITSSGYSQSAPLFVSQSLFHLLVNLDTTTSNCANLSHYSDWFDNAGFIRCDGAGATGFTLDSTSTFVFDGVFSSEPHTVVANGGYFLAGDMAEQQSSDLPTLIRQYEASTSASPGEGASYYMAGSYWNGTASALDEWKVATIPSSSSSFLSFQHVTGPSTYALDATGGVRIDNKTFRGAENTLLPNTVGHYNNTLPASNGTLALQGANGVSAGRIPITYGSGSHVFKSPYSSAPVCTAADSTNVAPVEVNSTPAAVYVYGHGGDVVSWICAPAGN